MGKLNLYSLNARGLRQQKKRLALFRFFKRKQNAIILLQETHSVITDDANWKKEWGGEIIFSHGAYNSKGVAILIPQNSDPIIEKTLRDDHGRYLAVKISINENIFTIINLYAPTKDKTKEQISFFNSLLPLIDQSDINTIIGGDFNICLNSIDKSGGRVEPVSAYATLIKNFMDENDYVDVWRLMNPDTKRFTWRESSRNGIIQSRLDYWLIPQHMLYNVNNADIISSIHSDHSVIELNLDISDSNSRGRGFWKFNCQLLTDNEYVNKITQCITDCKAKYKDTVDKGLIWDAIKMEIRGISISHSSYLAKQRKKAEEELYRNLNRMEITLASDPSIDNKNHYNKLKAELEDFNSLKIKGALLRAKAEHIELNEKNTSFFLKLEQKNGDLKNIKRLKVSNGSLITDPLEILNEQKLFYEELYSDKSATSTKDIQISSKNFINDTIINETLNEIDRKMCDSPLSYEEIAKAVKELPNNKSPGSDGFSIEFYKFFWKDVKCLVTDSILYGLDKGILSIDQRRGVLALIPKKGKDVTLLKNWRPLTLLNTHYKILAKILAIRLQKVLYKLISPDQSGYLKGRYIGNNIRNIYDILEFTKQLQLHGMIVFIDFEKAFDTIKWEFLINCLSAFGFGPYFVKCVKTLYKEISTCVTNNGHASSFFTPQRGIRQGCPLSALLFLLVVETLSLAIKKKKSISGIEIEGTEFKISQLADDTTLFLKDTNSLREALNLLGKFSIGSGLQINRDKSEAIWIGASSNFRHKPCGLKWTHDFIKCLGIYVGQDIDKAVEKNYTEKLKRVENLIQLWSARPLTLKGKITVVQNLIIPQILYPCAVLYTPETVIKRLHELVTQFVWNGKKPKVKHCTMIGSVQDGGLNLPDVRAKIKAIKIAWLQRMCANDNLFWKYFCKSIFNVDCNMIPHCTWSKRDIDKISNKFYKQVLHYWLELYDVKVNTAEDVYKQIIWNNSNIRIGNKTVFFKKWIDKGVLTISDVTTLNGNMLSQEEFCNKFNIYVNFLEYLSLISAIPKQWRNLIRNVPNTNFTCDFEKGPVILVRNVSKHLTKLQCKDFYLLFIDKIFVKPTSKDTWAKKSGLNFDDVIWKFIYNLPYSLTTDTRLHTFHFKIVHRIFACNYNLHIWKKRDNSLCEYCNNTCTDDLYHYFIDCSKSAEFWKSVFIFSKTTLKISMPLDKVEMLFGILNFNGDNVLHCLNFVLLTGKYFIFNCKSQATDIVFTAYCKMLRSLLESKKYTMYKNSKSKEFDDIWSPLLQSL